MSESIKQYPEVYGLKTFCEVADVTKGSAYVMLHKRQVPFYKRPGSARVYFRHREIIDWLTQKRVPTISEIAENAMV